MKPLASRLALLHDQVVGEDSVKRVRPSVHRNSVFKIEVATLTHRVGAAIRSTGSYDLAILARDLAYSIFQGALDSSLPFLCGPAAKVSALVRYGEL